MREFSCVERTSCERSCAQSSARRSKGWRDFYAGGRVKVWISISVDGQTYVGKKGEMTLDERTQFLESLCNVVKSPNYLQIETEAGDFLIFPKYVLERAVWTAHSEVA